MHILMIKQDAQRHTTCSGKCKADLEWTRGYSSKSSMEVPTVSERWNATRMFLLDRLEVTWGTSQMKIAFVQMCDIIRALPPTSVTHHLDAQNHRIGPTVQPAAYEQPHTEAQHQQCYQTCLIKALEERSCGRTPLTFSDSMRMYTGSIKNSFPVMSCP